VLVLLLWVTVTFCPAQDFHWPAEVFTKALAKSADGNAATSWSTK